LNFKRGELLISAIGDIGEAHEKMELEYKEEEIDLAFPPSFLIDFLEVIGKEEFLFAFTASNKPVLMKPHEDEFLYICMPLKAE
jgi:DNA polymerase III sliding clamp (beta) subunit (PCNA family)